jgi:hypothetical protein
MSGNEPGMGVHSLSQQIPNLRVTDGASGSGIHASGQRRPALNGNSAAMGVHRPPQRGEPQAHWQKRPDLHSMGKGVHAASGWNARPELGRRPDLTNAHGVHLPSLGNDRGIHGVSAPPSFEWFEALAWRLRRVRVACGDWQRVLGPSVLGKGKNVGGRRPCAVFLDPPYSHELRDPGLYSEDDPAVSALVRDWAIEHGPDPDLRIALCGYEGEHEMPEGWRMYRWTAARGYAGEKNQNRERERIWFSPHCRHFERQMDLFAF